MHLSWTAENTLSAALTSVSIGEAFGFLGALLILSAYSMRTMLALRLCAISSNLAMLAYGMMEGLLPVLLLHVCLFPLNVIAILRLARERKAQGGG